jgi:hypothetical protein
MLFIMIMPPMKSTSHIVFLFLLISGLLVLAAPSFAADAPNPHEVPAVDGGLGPCSIEFTAKDSTGSPLYNAKVRVHIATGFLGVKKTDLEVGSNVDGKAKFTGLPDKTKFSLEFDAQQGELAGIFSWTPAKGCSPLQENITLKKP